MITTGTLLQNPLDAGLARAANSQGRFHEHLPRYAAAFLSGEESESDTKYYCTSSAELAGDRSRPQQSCGPLIIPELTVAEETHYCLFYYI